MKKSLKIGILALIVSLPMFTKPAPADASLANIVGCGVIGGLGAVGAGYVFFGHYFGLKTICN
jgi:hypothetical protein